MGNFINTRYKDTVSAITEISKDILKNPYYLYNDKKSCNTTYYHINKEKSTLDEAARIPYADLGPECPFRFNVIKDFFIYGVDKAQLSLEYGDQGLESGEIGGEAIILPNTITPYPGDYFEIDHITDDTWLFRVNDVQKDTLDDGANIWKISYRLTHTDNSKIVGLVDSGDKYTMIVNNLGTSYNPIIKSDKYKLLEVVDNICVELKRYFRELFYSEKVQTFIFVGTYQDYFYDPYMIEFIVRNGILKHSESKEYMYIDHKLPLPATFSIDYNKTFFHSFEMKDKNHLLFSQVESTADYIENIVSIFHSRPEDYFQMNYKVYQYDKRPTEYIKSHSVIQCFPYSVVDAIAKNGKFKEDEFLIYNIFIKYFNDKDITEEDLNCIDRIDYNDSMEIFYMVPLLIFCLEQFAKNTLLA